MRVGIVFPPDYANDREAWRWCPDGVSLLATRTDADPAWHRSEARHATDPEAISIPSNPALRRAVRSLLPADPVLVTYACTSCSFLGRSDHEARVRRLILDAGAPLAQTTSGAVLDALDALDAACVSVATPYSGTVTSALAAFLTRRGYRIASLTNIAPTDGHNDADLTPDQTFDLVARANHSSADVVLVSSTALETFDLIPALEAELGKPVLTATQVTMWAALGEAGVGTVPATQTLLERAWRPSSRRDP